MQCGNCGKEVREDLNFCTFCGKRITSSKENSKQRSKFPKPLIPVLTGAIIVIIIITLIAKMPASSKNSFDLSKNILNGVWYEYSFQDASAYEWIFYDDGTCTREMRGEGGERKYDVEYATYYVKDNKAFIYKDARETEWEYDFEEDCCWLYFGDEYGSYKFKITHYGQKITQEALDKTFYEVSEYIISLPSD